MPGPAAGKAVLPARGTRATVPTAVMDPRERALIDINASDILTALGWENIGFLRRWVALAVRAPAAEFACRMNAFDQEVDTAGVRAAARTMLASYVRRLRVCGARGIPDRGPALLLSNHPGMTDTLALFAAIPRDDLRILAADRPFLRALPAMTRSLILIDDRADQRMQAVRQAVRHLRSGRRAAHLSGWRDRAGPRRPARGSRIPWPLVAEHAAPSQVRARLHRRAARGERRALRPGPASPPDARAAKEERPRAVGRHAADDRPYPASR